MLKVALSPFFRENEYTDEASGLTFTTGKHGQIQIYDISNEKNLDGIRKAIRMNTLLLIEGELGQQTQSVQSKEAKEEVRVDTKEEPKEEQKASEEEEEKANEDPRVVEGKKPEVSTDGRTRTRAKR